MEFDCSLGGGNISTASQLSLDLFVIGEGSKLFPKRSEARPGENIYVSGPIGLARAGLDLLQKEISGFPSLIKAFVSPRPDFESSNYLEASCVRCVMDISDGLAGDAYHLAKASGITVEFIINPENYDPSHKAYCTRFGKSVVTEMIAGGEDYCLLFTCKEALYESKLKKILVDSFQVGRCLPFQGVYLKNIPKDCQSFQHTV
jgi:thiamine-monophosphate kinase